MDPSATQTIGTSSNRHLPRTPGVHSAILDLRDPQSGRIQYRTLVTIVASEAMTEEFWKS
jgi:hypothetical protein